MERPRPLPGLLISSTVKTSYRSSSLACCSSRYTTIPTSDGVCRRIWMARSWVASRRSSLFTWKVRGKEGKHTVRWEGGRVKKSILWNLTFTSQLQQSLEWRRGCLLVGCLMSHASLSQRLTVWTEWPLYHPGHLWHRMLCLKERWVRGDCKTEKKKEKVKILNKKRR